MNEGAQVQRRTLLTVYDGTRWRGGGFKNSRLSEYFISLPPPPYSFPRTTRDVANGTCLAWYHHTSKDTFLQSCFRPSSMSFSQHSSCVRLRGIMSTTCITCRRSNKDCFAGKLTSRDTKLEFWDVNIQFGKHMSLL